MKQELGWYFPDGEVHLPEWMRAAKQVRNGVLQYQFNKYREVLKYCKDRKLAIDVGGHVGQWSRNMVEDFLDVAAFEPVPAYAECWRANLAGYDNAELFPIALGAAPGVVSLKCGTPGSHGDTFVAPRDEANIAFDVVMGTIDQFELEPDLIKIDCEGYELFVLQGGEKTIRACKPCVIVEQKPGKGQGFGLKETAAVDLLLSWGARQRSVISGDYILSWD